MHIDKLSIALSSKIKQDSLNRYIDACREFKLLYSSIDGLNTTSDKSKLNSFISSTIERISVLTEHLRYKEATNYIEDAIKVMDTVVNSRDIELAIDNIDYILSYPDLYKSLDKCLN